MAKRSSNTTRLLNILDFFFFLTQYVLHKVYSGFEAVTCAVTPLQRVWRAHQRNVLAGLLLWVEQTRMRLCAHVLASAAVDDVRTGARSGGHNDTRSRQACGIVRMCHAGHDSDGLHLRSFWRARLLSNPSPCLPTGCAKCAIWALTTRLGESLWRRIGVSS